MKILLLIFCAVILFNSVDSYPQDFFSEKEFIRKYLNDSVFIVSDFDKSTDDISNRFGISYSGIPQKILADKSFDKEKLSVISLENFKFLNLEDNYSVAKLDFNSISADFYFKEGKYIPEIFYKTRNYKTRDTKFLKIFYRESHPLNQTSLNKLDEFVADAIEKFGLQSELENIEREKLYYVYAGSPEEVERLIGVKSRGIFFISSDVVVSAYPCHFHEICHFLINLKIKNDLKPTFPLFLEGFAVAFGGRGGIDRNVEISTGEFLLKSGFAELDDVLTFNRFYENDLSISYSVSAYLINSIYHKYGFQDLLSHYKKYSVGYENIYSVEVEKGIFDIEHEFMSNIKLLTNDVNYKDYIINENGLKIVQIDSGYFFSVSKNVVLLNDETENSVSNIFDEKFPDSEYHNERYLIECDDSSVKVYDLHTEELLAMLSKGFMSENVVFRVNGFINFFLSKSVFDKNISSYQITVR